jgi:hypothetical protein
MSRWDKVEVGCHMSTTTAPQESSVLSFLQGNVANSSHEPFLTLQYSWENVGSSDLDRKISHVAKCQGDDNQDSSCGGNPARATPTPTCTTTSPNDDEVEVDDFGLTTACEAFLNVETLLVEILSHFKSMK